MMLALRARRYLLALIAMIVVLAGAVGCGSSEPAGPVQMSTIGGQPAFDFGGGVVAPGQTEDGEADVVNSGHHPVTITAVRDRGEPGRAVLRDRWGEDHLPVSGPQLLGAGLDGPGGLCGQVLAYRQ